MEVQEYDRGRIVYLGPNKAMCNSWVLVPGTAILPTGLLAVAYCATLAWLFLGIGIVSDIFMSAIEKITSSTQILKIKNDEGDVIRTKKVSVWNPTVANLTLMALGSSAPEILLSVIETVTSLGQCPGELGPSTIVGSAAFNLLVISGASIYAVSPETDTGDRDETMEPGVKKINDMGVFSITSFFSIFAYLWLFYVLYDQVVEVWEAWLTLIFFFLLVGLAFGADKYNSSKNEGLLE